MPCALACASEIFCLHDRPGGIRRSLQVLRRSLQVLFRFVDGSGVELRFLLPSDAVWEDLRCLLPPMWTESFSAHCRGRLMLRKSPLVGLHISVQLRSRWRGGMPGSSEGDAGQRERFHFLREKLLAKRQRLGIPTALPDRPLSPAAAGLADLAPLPCGHLLPGPAVFRLDGQDEAGFATPAASPAASGSATPTGGLPPLEGSATPTSGLPPLEGWMPQGSDCVTNALSPDRPLPPAAAGLAELAPLPSALPPFDPPPGLLAPSARAELRIAGSSALLQPPPVQPLSPAGQELPPPPPPGLWLPEGKRRRLRGKTRKESQGSQPGPLLSSSAGPAGGAGVAPSCLLGCPAGCLRFCRVGKRKGEQCRVCHALVRHSVRASRCHQCAGLICGRCARGAGAGAAEGAAADPVLASGPRVPVRLAELVPEDPSADGLQECAAILRGLPELIAVPQYKHIPRQLHRRYSITATVVLGKLKEQVEWAARPKLSAEQAKTASDTMQFWSLFLRSMPALFLRMDAAPTSTAAEKRPAKDVVGERLRLWESGSMLELCRSAQIDSEVWCAAGGPPEQAEGCADLPQDKFSRSVEAALRKFYAQDVKAAVRMLREQSILPPTEATFAKAQCKFKTEVDEHCLSQKPELLKKAGEYKGFLLTTRHVRHAICELSDAKAAGASGWRAGYLRVVTDTEEGLSAFTWWCNQWTRNTMPDEVKSLWRLVTCIALDKGLGAVRPLLLGEVFLKVPSAATLRLASRDIIRLLSGHGQYGAGIPGGAASVLTQLKAAGRIMQDPVLITNDVRNAFGECRRATVVEEFCACAQVRLAVPLLLALWGSCTPVVMRCARGAGASSYRCFEVHDGLYQGEAWSSLAFCMALRRTLLRLKACLPRGEVLLMAYIDDIVLMLEASVAKRCHQLLRAELAREGLELQVEKSVVYDAAGACGPLAAELGCQYSCSGVTILGSEYAWDDAGSWFSFSESVELPAVVQKRLDKALGLADCLERMLVQGSYTQPVPQAAWHIARTVLNVALDFDSHCIIAQSLWAAAGKFDERVLEVVGRMLRVSEGQLPVYAAAQLRLGWKLGGWSLPSLQGKLRYSFLHFLSSAPEAALHCAEALCRPLPEVQAALGPEVRECRRLLQVLESEQGIAVSIDGEVAVVAGAAFERLHEGDVWQCARPLACSIRQLLDARVLEQLLEGQCWPPVDHTFHAARLRALGGEVSGRALVDHPSSSGEPLASARQWVLAGKFRLGLKLGVTRCGLSTKEGERCTCVLDAWGSHALGCGQGVLVTARHAAFRKFGYDIGRLCGFAALTEQCIPQLGVTLKKRKQPDGTVLQCWESAYVDVLLTAHAGEGDRLLDVTWRSPFAADVLQRSAKVTGVAALQGERDKAKRYPAVGEVHVECWSCEITGRAGEALSAALTQMATFAAEVQAQRGYRASDWAQLWRGKLSGLAHRLLGQALDRAYALQCAGDRELVCQNSDSRTSCL